MARFIYSPILCSGPLPYVFFAAFCWELGAYFAHEERVELLVQHQKPGAGDDWGTYRFRWLVRLPSDPALRQVAACSWSYNPAVYTTWKARRVRLLEFLRLFIVRRYVVPPKFALVPHP